MQDSVDRPERSTYGEGYMEDEMRNRVFDAYHEMRGLAAVLDAAAHGDMSEPERIVEYASGQISRLSDTLAAAISDRPHP
ncbi:Uncharacterised protein [Collinsella aerofaciens]|nr:Uncharacterised protein [Collinsella aerofaciens]